MKIRLQVQGEVAKSAAGATAVVEPVSKKSAMWIVKNLGLSGLYRGAAACLLRDVPFSAIYFPTYSNLKTRMFGETPEKKLSIWKLLVSGAIAGMPAAYLTTPCDVIKTRLQVQQRANEESYTSVRQTARSIWQQEGFRAFFKGGPARIMRSSPQFGFTLAAYELLQNTFPMSGAKHNTASQDLGSSLGSSGELTPHIRSRNALKLILDVDESLGQLKLPDATSWQRLPSLLGGRGVVRQ